MLRRVRTLPAWICVSVHVRLRVRVYLWKKLTCYIFSDSAWDFASFESTFSFLRQFWCFLLFKSQTLMTSLFLDFYHMQYQLCHEWVLHNEKHLSYFEQFSGFKCIPTTNSCFFTHKEITQDFENFNNPLIKHIKYWSFWKCQVSSLNSSTARSLHTLLVLLLLHPTPLTLLNSTKNEDQLD